MARHDPHRVVRHVLRAAIGRLESADRERAAGRNPRQGLPLARDAHARAGSWQLAGAVGRHEAAGFWFVAVPEERWPDDPARRSSVLALMQGEHGDRRQEVVFIDYGMDEQTLRARLDACLLTDDEMQGGPRAWAKLPEPIPRWASV